MAKHQDGVKELFQACSDGKKDVVAPLLSKGVSINEKDEQGHTALDLACSKGHESVVSLLLSHDRPTGEKVWQRALGMACSNGHGKIASILMENGAYPDSAHVQSGFTALIHACANGHSHLVELLEEWEADLNVRDTAMNTALIHACKAGHNNVVEALVARGVKLNLRGEDKRTALMWTCEDVSDKLEESEKIVEFLVKSGANVNVKDLYGYTVLISACEIGSEKMVKILLENGADANVKNAEKETALMLASMNGHGGVVELLIQHGIDVNECDDDGETALMYACRAGHNKVLKLLIERVDDIDRQSKTTGLSAVMLAAKPSDPSCLQTLLQLDLPKAPNLDVVDKEGKTVFSHAMQNGTAKCLEALLTDGRLLNNENLLKQVHKESNAFAASKESLVVAIKFGVFEWEWCSRPNFKDVSLAALESGLSPGKITYDSVTKLKLSPLVASILENDAELAETFLKRAYYLPEDYKTLTTDKNVTDRITDTNTALLKKITGQLQES